jgi:threonine dehydratase
VPHDCPPKKIDATRACGGTVFLTSPEPEARLNLAQKIHNTTGAVIVPPADHVNIVLGQATAVSEFLDQVEERDQALLDAIIVPSGGGGLLVGAVAAGKPRGVVIYGAEPAYGGPGLANALRNGKRSQRLEQKPTIADGLRSLTGAANWDHIKSKENVKLVLTASEDEISVAMRLALEELGLVIEPSAAVALAVSLFDVQLHREITNRKGLVRIGVVLTGGNISVKALQELVPGV